MKILVTAKRVLDPETKIRVKPDKTGVVTDGVKYVVNPFDEIAVEEALRFREKLGGEVVVVSIGPSEVSQQIRQAMAMGADRGILVKTDVQADSEVVARCLVKVFDLEKPDIVVMGKQAVDGDSNQAGQLLAEYLGVAQACFASKITVSEDRKNARVVREVDGGLETIDVKLPAVVTADLRLNEPRYPSLPLIMKAKTKPLKEMTTQQLGVEVKPVVKVLGLEEPSSRKAGQIVPDVQTLVKKLKEEAKVI